jgi:hypothetical protein
MVVDGIAEPEVGVWDSVVDPSVVVVVVVANANGVLGVEVAVVDAAVMAGAWDVGDEVRLVGDGPSDDGVGFGVGDGVGRGVGLGVGDGVGDGVSDSVTAGVGDRVGAGVGDCVGAGVGFGVGTGVGAGVGFGVGAGVGNSNKTSMKYSNPEMSWSGKIGPSENLKDAAMTIVNGPAANGYVNDDR